MSTCVATSIDIALLGCGNVGSAFARLAVQDGRAPLNITGALVRDTARPRGLHDLPPLISDARALLAERPGVVVELLGGTEPARSLLIESLARRIPVVTANKTLLARHGGELRAAASATRTPLLYEAAVLAGVPFLGTFARRPHAAAASGLVGIANGTSNFILTQCASEGKGFEGALTDAQRRGYAEPDPRHDVAGTDAAEKLAVLLQQFARTEVSPDAIETVGIDTVDAAQMAHARELGGVVKPLIFAEWRSAVEAFVGPAFVPGAHPLSHVDGVENALILNGVRGRLLFQGPGAGPDVTAATVLDDVAEIAAGVALPPAGELISARPAAPATEWMITLDGGRLPRAVDVADLLSAHGIYPHRVSARHTRDGRESQSLLVWPARRSQLEPALEALCRASGCSARTLRALEAVQ
jgi:homoserine dehydrogenase